MSFTNFKHSNNGRRLQFVANNIDVSILNSIRRIILSEIPNVAIAFDPYTIENSDIVFKTNTSSLHNEFLGHRLSLIPIQLNEEFIETFANNKYSKCKLLLKKKNKTMEVLELTTDDIVIVDDNNNVLTEEEHHMIFPKNAITNDPILINYLKPNLYNSEYGEEVDVEMRFRIGIAKNHSRWSPVSTCTYFNVIDEELAELELQKKIAEDLENKKNIQNTFNAIDRYRYFVKNEFGEPIAFDFTIESECRLSPKYLFSKAMDILSNKLNDLLLKPDKYKVNTLDVENGMFLVTIEREDYTLGNIIQALFYKLFCRDGNGIEYIGYYKPHPLQDQIILKIKIDTKVFQDVDSLLKVGIPKVDQIIKTIKNTWNMNFISLE